MELYAKGQLSYLILNCLLERDFYGLDIITEINSKSGGKVNLKKPSVYSNLTRMEKQGYVSSYLKSSELGPNRKYYSITESGRAFYNEIEQYFTRNNIDMFSEFEDADIKELPTSNTEGRDEILVNGNNALQNQNTVLNTCDTNESMEFEDTSEDSDFFDFSSVNEKQEDHVDADFNFDDQNLDPTEQTLEESEQEDEFILNESNAIYDDKDLSLVQQSPLENEETIVEERVNEKIDDEVVLYDNSNIEVNDKQQNNYAYSIKNALLNTENDEESIKEKDDAVFLNKQEVASYNQRLYDISKDINSYKKKKSFAEDQISIAAEAPLLSSSTEIWMN